MPAIRFEGPNQRTGILIHPAHPPKLYLSSVGCFNPTNPVGPNENINFWDSRNRVLAILASLNAQDASAFAHQTMTRVKNAYAVIDGEPMNVLTPSLPAMVVGPANLPISEAAAQECANWLTTNFGPELTAAVADKSYGVKHLCAIVCQETAYKWLKWTATQSVKTIIERCVFDASGDHPGTSRSAFPVNTAAFKARYGSPFTDMLIGEANKTRRLQRWSDKDWVYKGYGIFQYDLQHVTTDEDFFRNKRWYDFNACLVKVVEELDDKLTKKNGDHWAAIKAYNGSGARATQYAENVKFFFDHIDA